MNDLLRYLALDTSNPSQMYWVRSSICQNLTDTIINSGLFPIPPSDVNTNMTWNLANATNRVATDGEFRCLDQATTAAAKNNIFPSVYAYEFDRSYMGYMPIPGTCVPAATEEYPYGDPSLPYFRTFDPNPSFAYLAARGYTNTTEALTKYGLWEPVMPNTPTPLRVFDVPLSNSPYLEQAQCDLLGYPLTFYG
ncbi:hypothetical protein OG21DRAFT_1601431 [Imleria badia]|nr:hypothetical protein OG21DRAFT_1601431 [Imleria badia]